MKVSIQQPSYLPWLGLIHRIAVSDLHVYLDTCQFDRSGFNHRAKIRTPQGWQWLTVPVQHPTMVPINEAQIAGDHWQRKHIAAIQQHYRRAKHYEAHRPTLDDVLGAAWPSIADIGIATTQYLMDKLDIETPLVRSSELGATGAKSDLVLAICREVGATTYLSGPFGRNYLDLAAFERAGIAIEFHDYQHPVYEQLYLGFEPYMSAIDLLFNHGPEAKEILMGER